MTTKILMKIAKLSCIGCIAVFVSACGMTTIQGGGATKFASHNETPVATNFPTSTQLKLQAAEHWKKVATDAAVQLSDALNKGGQCVEKHGCQTLVIKRPCTAESCKSTPCDTEFNKVFYETFVSALVAQGKKVSTSEQSSGAEVLIDITPVRFGDNRSQYRFAGEKVELGNGVWAIKDVALLLGTDGTPVQPHSLSEIHWHRSEFALGKTPSSEIVVTVSAINTDRTYLARNSNVYYVADSDAGRYLCATPAPTAPPKQPPAMEKPKEVEAAKPIPVYGDCTPGRCVTCAMTGTCAGSRSRGN